MVVIDVVLCFSFDGFFVYVSGVFEEINPRKPKLVRYALDIGKVEFDLSQDPESWVSLCECWGKFENLFFFFCIA